MGFIRKTVRAGSILTVGVPVAHKRSKKDKIVAGTEAIAAAVNPKQSMADRLNAELAAKKAKKAAKDQPQPSVADELAKLADLHQQGALSVAEFEQAKAKLLS